MAIKKANLIVDMRGIDGNEYEIAGGGALGPSSVGSEELKDGSVGKVDVDDEVKEGLDELNNVGIEDKDIEDIFFPDGDVPDGIYDDINKEEDADTEQNG